MHTDCRVITGKYFDSVTLMRLSQKIGQMEGVIDSSIVMGTRENKEILKVADLFDHSFINASDNDLLVAIKGAKGQEIAENFDQLLQEVFQSQTKQQGEENYLSLDSALQKCPDANWAIIAINGKYAADEAHKALENNLNVLLFSDNVSLEKEVELKKLAQSKGLLLMGPDCGTAIINGVPLCFANVVTRGSIGVVAASGTGAQEVTTLISRFGGGISHAIGTGGRDLKKEVGGMMFLEGIRLLKADPQTKVLLLISKPPHPEVKEKIIDALKDCPKPIVTLFIGEKEGEVQTLQEAAFKSLQHIGINVSSKKMNPLHLKRRGKKMFIRALFSGGTFAAETQVIFNSYFDRFYSNVPLPFDKAKMLSNPNESIGHTIVDLGDDQFTMGKPHPMIDFSTRLRRIEREAQDPETAIILLDVVLGYGSHLQPLQELVPIIKKYANDLLFIGSVTGTDNDPQKRDVVVEGLITAGMVVADSNHEAAHLAAASLP